MKYFGLFLFCYLLTNCSRHVENQSVFYGEEQIIELFKEVEKQLDMDEGHFWDHPLYGPILIVDPESRKFYANQNNYSGTFERTNGLFTDTLPDNLPLANTAFDWDSIRWTMLLQPLPESKVRVHNLMIHELFHRIQPLIGFDSIYEQSNVHLDTYEGRVLLQLELEALKEVLSSTNPEIKKNHLVNAFAIRKERQHNQTIINAENSLELNEGLAEYTGLMLSGRSDEEINVHLISGINDFYKNKTFVRSFAYHTVPVYGFLLYKSDPNWHRTITRSTNLTHFFLNAFNIEPNNNTYVEIGQNNNYNYEGIINKERVREHERIKNIEILKRKFIEHTTLKLPFEHMNISFDPRDITPLDGIGTVYPALRIADNWGILTVENGALISSDWSYVLISVPSNISNGSAKGDGWVLELNKGWRIINKDSNFQLIKD